MNISMYLTLTKSIAVVDALGRPIISHLSIEAAATWLRDHADAFGPYLEAHFHVVASAPRSVDHQIAVYRRRLTTLGLACGRVVSRIDPILTNVKYRAVLAR